MHVAGTAACIFVLSILFKRSVIQVTRDNSIKYLVFDIESVPDADLIRKVKYPDLGLDDRDAIVRFQEEILTNSNGSSYFIPVTFQIPVSLCMALVRNDYSIADIISLDEPEFRTEEMTRQFWNLVEKKYNDASMVTFNGRGFDVPLMELMAFRYGYTASRHFKDKFAGRFRFGTKHIDVHDWLSNYNAVRMQGGLNLLAKMLGKPGKMGTSGDDVHDLYVERDFERINQYCIHDVLDTYFVFLRTRVLLGEVPFEQEQSIITAARNWMEETVDSQPAFIEYLENWSE